MSKYTPGSLRFRSVPIKTGSIDPGWGNVNTYSLELTEDELDNIFGIVTRFPELDVLSWSVNGNILTWQETVRYE